MEAAGVDSDGKIFENAAQMWREHLGDNRDNWYRNGVGFWQEVEASVEGVLGGFGKVSDPDIKASEAFLQHLLSDPLITCSSNRHLVALVWRLSENRNEQVLNLTADCGSGIGRVTKNLLIRYFNEVDLLEPVSHFLEAARQSLASEDVTTVDEHKAVNFYCVPLQEFIPEPGRYDVIWIQWCIGHLTDDDFISFFKSAKAGLKPGGFFILKENIAKSGFVLDKEDCSVTRSDPYFKELFKRCGLHIYKIKDQKGFPKELFAVKMYVLTTEVPKRSTSSRSRSYANRPALIK